MSSALIPELLTGSFRLLVLHPRKLLFRTSHWFVELRSRRCNASEEQRLTRCQHMRLTVSSNMLLHVRLMLCLFTYSLQSILWLIDTQCRAYRADDTWSRGRSSSTRRDSAWRILRGPVVVEWNVISAGGRGTSVPSWRHAVAWTAWRQTKLPGHERRTPASQRCRRLSCHRCVAQSCGGGYCG